MVVSIDQDQASVLKPVLDVLAQEEAVAQAILFGNRARGDHRPRSDIDIAVDCPGADYATWGAIQDALEEADEAFLAEIRRTGTVVYERGSAHSGDRQSDPRT